MHGYVEGTTKLHPIQFHIYCVCNLKTTTGFQNEKRTNKQTNKQTNKKDWHFHSFSTIYGHSSRCSLADFYISKFIRTALTLSVAAFETYESQVIVRGYKRANGIKWANRVTTTRLCQTQCRNTRSVFIRAIKFFRGLSTALLQIFIKKLGNFI